MESKILKKVDYTLVNGGFSPASERIVKETTLTINVNGREFATAMILATLEKEFVIGNLYTQGIVHSAADITSITVKNNTADVRLTERKPPGEKPQKVISDLKVRREDVFECVRAILKSKVFTETEAVHSAGLFLART